MAEKSKKTSSHGGGGGGAGVVIIAVIIVAIVVFFVFGKSSQPLNPNYPNLDYIFGEAFLGIQSAIRFFIEGQVGLLLKGISAIVSIFLIGLIVYLITRLLEMEREHVEHVYHLTDHPAHVATASAVFHTRDIDDDPLIKTAPAPGDVAFEIEQKPGSARWEVVLDHISSNNASDWRLAIIEADLILDELAFNTGFAGSTLGERLNNADKGVFQTLDDAKEAHGVRNRIAHMGSEFDMTHREAQQAISRYENVFREFDYI